MIRSIVPYGNPMLTTCTKPVRQLNREVHALIGDMFETMDAAGGVGLAAPQVNVSLRLFILAPVSGTENLPKPFHWPGWVFINPELVEETGLRKTDIEGCLSIPGVEVSLDRPTKIRLKYLNEDFETQERTFTGFPGRVIQHELDHVDGVLITDRVNHYRRRSLRQFLKQVAGGEIRTDYEMLYEKV